MFGFFARLKALELRVLALEAQLAAMRPSPNLAGGPPAPRDPR